MLPPPLVAFSFLSCRLDLSLSRPLLFISQTDWNEWKGYERLEKQKTPSSMTSSNIQQIRSLQLSLSFRLFRIFAFQNLAEPETFKYSSVSTSVRLGTRRRSASA